MDWAMGKISDLETHIKKLEKQRDNLLEECKNANVEIIASIEIPTDKRLEKDKNALIYVIRDMLARANKGQQILKQAIAEAEKNLKKV